MTKLTNIIFFILNNQYSMLQQPTLNHNRAYYEPSIYQQPVYIHQPIQGNYQTPEGVTNWDAHGDNRRNQRNQEDLRLATTVAAQTAKYINIQHAVLGLTMLTNIFSFGTNIGVWVELIGVNTNITISTSHVVIPINKVIMRKGTHFFSWIVAWSILNVLSLISLCILAFIKWKKDPIVNSSTNNIAQV